MASMFSEIFGRVKDQPIVMASPRLAAVIQAIKTDPTSSRVS